jgi:hypothetical protein
MADSTILNLDLMTTGSNSGTWGSVTNENLQKLENAIKGYVSISVAGSGTQALTIASGGTGDQQSRTSLKFTGTLTGTRAVECEAHPYWYFIHDATTRDTNILTFGPAGGTAVTIPVTGAKYIIYCDGSSAFDVGANLGNIAAANTLTVSGDAVFNGGTFTYNSSGADKDAQFYGDSDNNLLYLDAGNDRVGLGVSAPEGKVEIDQNSATGGVVVLNLDQGDADQPFIDYVGTSATDDSSSISSSTAEASAKFGAIMVKINGAEKWIRIYDDPT